MDDARSSHDLLAHFDRPHAVAAPDVARPMLLPTRGIVWVLQWAAALTLLAFAAGVLIEFAYLVGAERTLARAARAGALEATLPRATFQSVTGSVERRLTQYPGLSRRLRFSLQQNGHPTRRNFQPTDGDRISLTLTADADAMLPGWLPSLHFWRTASRIEAHAERQMPGRRMIAARSR